MTPRQVDELTNAEYVALVRYANDQTRRQEREQRRAAARARRR